MTSTRSCTVCGKSIEDLRSDALVCSSPCRRERVRVLAILSGRGADPYFNLRQWTGRRLKPRASRRQAA